MHPDQSSNERRLLMFSAGGNLLSATLGVVFAVLTSSRAILLDGLFDVTYFLAALFTLKVASLVHREDDDHFPYGYVFFEPLVNGLKGVLVLGVCLMALADAVSALLAGGREIAAGLAIVYGGIAAVLCSVISFALRRENRQINSPLIRVDAENWMVNATISACVIVAFSAILFLKHTPWAHLAPYVDPLIVVAVILFSVSVPIHMAWRALMELLNRTPSPEIRDQVRMTVKQVVSEWPVTELFVRVIQPGRARLVLAHVVLPTDESSPSLHACDALRVQTLKRLQALHPTTVLDMIFTADRFWGAPTGVTQSVPPTAEPSDPSPAGSASSCET